MAVWNLGHAVCCICVCFARFVLFGTQACVCLVLSLVDVTFLGYGMAGMPGSVNAPSAVHFSDIESSAV